MNSLWIILACGVACANAQPTCDDSLLQRCEDMMPSIDNDDLLPSDLPTLQKKCRKAVPGFECYTKVSELCPMLLPEPIKEYYIAARDLSKKVCKGGYFQTMYLKNVGCIKDILDTKQTICQEKADQEAKEGKYYFKSYEDCLDTFVHDICGGQAGEVFDEILKVMQKIF